jgi:hypothetical protein
MRILIPLEEGEVVDLGEVEGDGEEVLVVAGVEALVEAEVGGEDIILPLNPLTNLCPITARHLITADPTKNLYRKRKRRTLKMWSNPWKMN